MKKSVFRKLAPFIIFILLFSSAIIYVHFFGMSDDDVINRTVNFWLPTSLLALACAVFWGDDLIDAIKVRDRLKVAILIIQALIVVVALVYAYMLTTEIIPLSQQIEECMKTDDYKHCHQLMDDQLELRAKRDWTTLLVMVIVIILDGVPHLIRRLSSWYNDKKKRGEDH